MGDYVKAGHTAIDVGCGGGIFTVELAKMTGENGRVIAVDLQQEMLDITRELAKKKGVSDRITLHRCKTDDIDLAGQKADFVLAFYVVHEVPDRNRFLHQIAELLKPDAHFMIIEPKHHVTPAQFDDILSEAASVGLKYIKQLKVLGSRGMVFGIG